MNPSQHQPNDEAPRRAKPHEGPRAFSQKRTPGGLEQRLLARTRRAGFRREDRLVVAFSGGRDSLALAAALRRPRDVIGLEVLLVHIDHRLRAGSGDDAARAADLAAALGLDFQGLVVGAIPQEMHPGVGLEEAARRERYRLLVEAAGEAGAKAIATGHHQQDQAETVLLHLLRGGGVHGAVGMSERAAPVQGSPASDISPELSTPWLWRPMLAESRLTIDEYVALIGLEWIEDPSNADLALRRNVVRNQILPILEAEFPGASAALARYASLAAADDEALEQIVQSALECQVDPGGRLRVASLARHPLAVQRRMIRRWFGDRTGYRDLTADRTDAILDLGSSGRGNRTIEAGGGWTVSLQDGTLRVRRNGMEERDAR
ncbi:MAG: tRNA(Ile)-lysidine synthetase [Thermomicrobiales bacterium]|nr:tRNA(Ile)-lysidine synthetase [Thermomicrobiales bacterium]